MQEFGQPQITYDQGIVSYTFNEDWQQEDIAQLASTILGKLDGFNQLEHIAGADREDFRLKQGDIVFKLSFDMYSQSIWLEGEDQAAREYLATLFNKG
ncbi:DUF3630 family protein [Thalassotalea agarivorans]|uniref:DUF3630 domain-containing protein n=1 Tax=Thalassotalea agarivorans TaxID=349064 RepID=A0A1I0CNT6_THASX|nr:DUF3630 family protein [Thalassotalea agarivorans]SET21401.1 Protein of unknown function [Thalassotalea agarivorans]